MTAGDPFDPLTFFQAVDEFQNSSGSSSASDAPLRLATVDPAYLGAGAAKVTFDGESALTVKQYQYITRAPAASDRVVLAPYQDTYVILGVLNYVPPVVTQDFGYLSTARPISPYRGMFIYETDTTYVRMWNGTAWKFVSAPEQSWRHYRLGGSGGWNATSGTGNSVSYSAADQIIGFDERTVVGDHITNPNATTIVCAKPGLYHVWGQFKFASTGGSPPVTGQYAVSVRRYTSGGTNVDTAQSFHVSVGTTPVMSTSKIMQLNAGDSVALYAYDNPGAPGVQDEPRVCAFAGTFIRPLV
jgi:hypothetical protein